MGSSSQSADLVLLEQAELAARERRLAASTEADAIVASGRERAASILAAADTRVTEALQGLRQRLTAEADEVIATLERDAQARARTQPGSPAGDPAVAQAVDLVVAAVLGESSTEIA